MTDASQSLKAFLATGFGQYLKGLGIRLAGRLGYEIVATDLQKGISIIDCLSRHGVRTVIDVGANQGQFGLRLRRLGWKGPILSVEPLPAAFHLLEGVAKRRPPWDVVQVAAGSSAGEAIMHVSRNSVSSSLLNPARAHIDAAPLSTTTERIHVAVEPLEEIIRRADPVPPFFLKIDAQGYELEVLKGAQAVIPLVTLLQMEVSFRLLYEDQAPWLDTVHYVHERGFRVIGIEPALVDSETCELLQVDFLFARDVSGAPSF